MAVIGVFILPNRDTGRLVFCSRRRWITILLLILGLRGIWPATVLTTVNAPRWENITLVTASIITPMLYGFNGMFGAVEAALQLASSAAVMVLPLALHPLSLPL
jgi:hypothetical protein